MSDIKDDAVKAETDVKAGVLWVKAHWVLVAGLGGFIVGCFCGHLF